MILKVSVGTYNSMGDSSPYRKFGLHYFKIRNSSLQLILIGVCLGITIGLSFINLGEAEIDCSYLSSSNENNGVSPTYSSRRDSSVPSQDVKRFVQSMKLLSNSATVKQQFTFRRPRFFYTELGLRKKLFGALILTETANPDYLIAFNRTAAKDFDKLIIFVGGRTGDEERIKKLTELGFTGVVDLSGLRRSTGTEFTTDGNESAFIDRDETLVRVLSYLTEKYSESYDYFFFVTQETFVNGRLLMEFVSKISVREEISLGVPNQDRCHIDHGFILSRRVLQRFGTRIDHCYLNIALSLPNHFSKCLDMTFAAHPCRQSIQRMHYTISQPDKTVSEAITIRGFRSPMDFYLLQDEISRYQHAEAQVKIQELQQKIESLQQKLPTKFQHLDWPVGFPGSFVPKTRFDVRKWEYVQGDKLYGKSEQSTIQDINGIDKEDLTQLLNSSIEFLRQESSTQSATVELLHVYRRFDPVRGMEYLLDFKNIAKRKNIRIQALRSLSKMELVPMPFVTESRKIFIIVPIMFEPLNQIRDFLTSYFDIRASRKENTVLILLILTPGDAQMPTPDKRTLSPSEVEEIKNIIFAHNARVTKNSTDAVKAGYILVPKRNIKFANPYLTGVDSVIKRIVGSSALIFTADLRTNFEDEFLNRIRINTVPKWQAFSPIPFVEYNPEVYETEIENTNRKILEVSKTNGYFDADTHHYFAFFTGDYLAARKNISSNVTIQAELSKLTSYEVLELLFIKATNVHVLRTVDPKLKIRYKNIVSSAGDLQSCLKYKCGSKSQLFRFLVKNDMPVV